MFTVISFQSCTLLNLSMTYFKDCYHTGDSRNKMSVRFDLHCKNELRSKIQKKDPEYSCGISL